jgi:dihydrofolate synthase/folylpolyglutamate synthase
MEYKDAIDYLYDLKIYGMSLGLERIEHLLNSLGSPQESLKIVHVAGTNGKGSVCAMISSILQSVGYKVGLFTSPHLIDFGERIRVNWEPIPNKRLSKLVEKIKPIAESMVTEDGFEHPTFFEIACAMALYHFKEENVDYAIMEVGLGGRLDATNIVKPLVSVITSVDLDHTHVLGEKLHDVAREKAGIIKEGVPVVTGVKQKEILELIEKICENKKCPLYALEKHARYTPLESNFDYQSFELRLNDTLNMELKIPLLGEHQLENAQIAVATIERLKEQGVQIPNSSVIEGLKGTKWPARFQIVKKNPYVVLDAAHNPSGMRVLGRTMVNVFGDTKKILIMGIMRDKDIPGIVYEASRFADQIIVTQPKFERSADPQIIFTEAKRHINDVLLVKEVSEALKCGISQADFSDVVCISGSIFCVGEAMGILSNGNPEAI